MLRKKAIAVLVFSLMEVACQSSMQGDSVSNAAGLTIAPSGAVTASSRTVFESYPLTFRGVTGARYSGPVPSADILIVVRRHRLGICTRIEASSEYSCAMNPINDRSSSFVGSKTTMINGADLLYALAFAPAPIVVSTLHIPKGELYLTAGQPTSNGWTNVVSWSLHYVPAQEVAKLKLITNDGLIL
ncbi:hypothetical protein EC912_108121 [Luteibacter rhizovicinus]|uniref:Uncharacterized protein n=1 Tax=Luteibacter rhizovicinus TaxID=242606 RepID=A0A4R3YIE1_9GAMM|nr:hypothetical protein EC912_108121 [Luteibacter rhizovicinus]